MSNPIIDLLLVIDTAETANFLKRHKPEIFGNIFLTIDGQKIDFSYEMGRSMNRCEKLNKSSSFSGMRNLKKSNNLYRTLIM